MVIARPRILIAAGGTGGHLFPALFIAQALRKLAPDSEIEFVGTGRPLEEKLVEGNGYRRVVLPIVGIRHRGVLGILQFLMGLPGAIFTTRRIFNSFMPDCVVGVGGYVTVLPVLYARITGIPSWIHEAECRPGLANSFLSWLANRISVANPKTRFRCMSKVVVTGHPVSPAVLQVKPGIKRPNPPTKLLVMGGSQGASAVDQALASVSQLLAQRKIEVWHQARPASVKMLTSAYHAAGVQAQVVNFIDDPALAYEWADIVIARSGAGTLSEVSVVGRPAIFVPYPGVGIGQLANAEILASAKKALIVEEGDGFVVRFSAALLQLLEPDQYYEMKERQGPALPKNAAESIAQGVLGLL